MKAPHWLKSFWSNLPWRLVAASLEARRIHKMQRKARRKQDGLATHLEDLEVRVMLSGTTAVNDQAILNQVNVPITLDVLANDVSANGELEIISASLSGATGTVTVIAGDPNGTGTATRDRVQVTLASNFTGNASVQYTIRDEQGNQSTASATVSMGSTPGTAFTSSSGGAMSVVGGTGNGHVATPTSRFTPTLSGNYSYNVATTGASYEFGDATGTQDISSTITTTSSGVATWSYVEHVVWSYDVTSSDESGNSQHLWGNYVYTFSASSNSSGIITTTLAYVGTDYFEKTIVSTSANSSSTTTATGSVTTTVTIINVDDVLDSGSIYYNKFDTTSIVGSGTYSRALGNGSISGTRSNSSTSNNTITVNQSFSQLTVGGFSVVGTISMTGGSNKESEYDGSGSYTEGEIYIVVTEGGSQGEISSYLGGGTYTNSGGWLLSGSGYTSGDNSSEYSYIGTGSYSREFHGGTINGTKLRSGHNNTNGDFRVDYTLGNTGWNLISGTNSAEGDSLSHYEYSGSGSYTFDFPTSSSGFSQTLSGSMGEDGHNTTRSNYSTQGTLNVSTLEWSYTGAGSGSGDNHDHLFYSGSGSYIRQFVGGVASGTANELYDHLTQGSYRTSSTLTPTGWVITGSGSANGTSLSHTDFEGSGSYLRTEGSGAGALTYAGYHLQNGHDTVQQSWRTSSELAATGLMTTYSEGSGIASNHDYSYYSGSASYSRTTSDGLGTIVGRRNEEREDFNSNLTTTETSAFDQEYIGISQSSSSGSLGTSWSVTTGTTSTIGRGFANTNWFGSASYTKSWTKSQGGTTSNYSGSVTVKEEGFVKNANSASSISTLNSAGVWIRTSGAGSSWGSDRSYVFHKTNGSYSTVSQGAHDRETSYSGSFLNSTESDDRNRWHESFTVAGGVFVQTAGNASGSGSYEKIDSNSGTGRYSHNNGAFNASMSGTGTEDNYARDASEYVKNSTWTVSQGWLTSGSMSSEGNSRNHSRYTGTGRMGTINPLSSGYVSASGTNSMMGTVNENGHTNANSKYSSVSTWSMGSAGDSSGTPAVEAGWKLESGSASDWGDGLTHMDWDGTGSYASGGFDNRWGNWSTNGTTTSRGHDNSENKWNKTYAVQYSGSGIEKTWVTTGGSASDWGDTRSETGHNATGTWSQNLMPLLPSNPLTSLSGQVTQSGSGVETTTWDINSTWIVGESASGGGWETTSGSYEGTSNSRRRDQFGYAVANYEAGGAAWMTGHMSAYGFNEVTDNVTWKTNWSSSVPTPAPGGGVVLAPGWQLVSGSGRYTETSGKGKEYTGSGTLVQGGSYTANDKTGAYAYTATATQSGKTEDSFGIFIESAVQSGSWAVTNFGAMASGFHEERSKYDGVGTFSHDGFTGDFTLGDKNYYRDTYQLTFSPASPDGTGTRNVVSSSEGYNSKAAEKQISWDGVNGLFKEESQGSGTGNKTVGFTWDVSLSYPDTEGGEDRRGQWIATTGTANESFSSFSKNEFAGSGVVSGSGLSVGFTSVSFKNRNNLSGTYSYGVVVQSPVVNPASGQPVEWNQTGGNIVNSSSGTYDSTSMFLTPIETQVFALDAIEISNFSASSKYSRNRVSSFASGGWTTTGTGLDTATNKADYDYSATETNTTTGGSETITESATDAFESTTNIGYSWVDQASGGLPNYGLTEPSASGSGASSVSEGGYWSATGTITETSNGTWGATLNRTQSWGALVRGTGIQGTQTTVYQEDYNYTSDATYLVSTGSSGQLVAVVSAGGGLGIGDGFETITANATGAYSASFDNGAGTIDGTANASMRDHEEWSYQHDLTLETAPGGGKQWVFSKSGDGVFDGFSKWDYAGAGEYDNTSTQTNGFSRASAVVNETGHNNSYYAGGYDWLNNTWNYDEEKWGDSGSSRNYIKLTSYSNTSSFTQNGHNNQTLSYGNGSIVEDYLSSGTFEESYAEVMSASGFSSSLTGTSAYSSEHSIDSDSYGYYSWDNEYTSPSYTSFSTGYSTTSTNEDNLWEEWGGSTWEEHSNGSTAQGTSSAGTHTWSSSYANNYYGNWGETWYYGGGSGSGSGGSYSTGGTDSYNQSSGGAGSPSWSFSAFSSTPANPPSSGGGTSGDGKIRTAAGYDLPSGVPSVLPSAYLPSITIPSLGSESVAGFETLGMTNWALLSGAATFWDGIDAIQDAYAWAGDQLNQLFDVASGWLEQAGIWSEQIFGFNGIELAGSFLAGMLDVGQAVYDFIGEIPSYIASTYDAISNLTVSDVLDGIQGILDVVGFIPGIGEIADGINGVISLARGDYVGAALSFTSMIPIVGDAIGKGGKAAKFIINKADDILAAGRNITCRITKGLCFEAGTEVLLSAIIEDGGPFGQYRVQSTATQIAVAIESVPLGSRVPKVNPRPWEYDGARDEPNSDDWAQLTLEYRRDDGSRLDIELLRPKAELERIDAKVGMQIPLHFNELLADGMATIKRIGDCPEIAHGDGNVVTARIVTRTTTELIEVELSGGVRFCGTPIHPVWSEGVADWVPMEKLRPGDRLLGDAGPVEIISVRGVRTVESVFNLEIHGDHVYQVTKLGILVHNACDSYWLGKNLAGGNLNFAAKIRKLGYAAGHIVPARGFKRSPEVVKAIKDARNALKRAGININDAANGFWTKNSRHMGTHTDKYLLDMGERLRGLTDKGQVQHALNRLRDDIRSGKYL
jgi:hypothetical protein